MREKVVLLKWLVVVFVFVVVREVVSESRTNSTRLSKQDHYEEGKPTNCPSLEGNMDQLTQEQFMARLTHACRYDKLIKPHTEFPLNISIQMDLRHIEAIEQLQFRTHMLVHYRFVDPRLAYKDVSPHRSIMLGEKSLQDRIWLPHVVLKNERQTSIMGIESKDTFISIKPNGEVIFSYRMTAIIYCWMDLKKFPFDTQECDINMISWAYNASELILYWEPDDPVKVANQLHLTEYCLSSYQTYSTLMTTSITHSAFIGNYSALVFKFKLDREIGFYMLTYYIPSIMLVCTSWVTFYLQADASAPRAILGTSTMLTFITLSAGQTRNLPKVSYIKFSEIWFLGIAVFIFASMAEFALVNMVWRRNKNIGIKKKSSKYILKSSITPRTSRKQFERSLSSFNLRKTRSCTNFDGDSDADSNTYRNYLTVHDFSSMSKIPTITTEADDRSTRHSTPKVHITDDDQDSIKRKMSLLGWTTMTPHEISNWIDKRSRIFFPIAFIIFNICYWTFVYLN